MNNYDGSSTAEGRVHHGNGRSGDDGVAIIGMSCLFPGAPNVDVFWQNILNKVDAVGDPPAEAWDLDVYYDPAFSDSDKVYCKRGGYLGGLVSFDPLSHGIPPVAVGGEPDQWLALQLARDAMVDANCTDLPEETRHRTAVILGKGTYLNGGNAIAVERGLVVGQTIEIIKRLHPEYTEEQIALLRDEMKQSLPPIGPETVSGLIPNIIVGRIANRLDLMGPAYTVDAACASSLVAIQHAVADLQTGACDLVLAGGSQVWMPVPTLNVFCQLGALSRRGEIRPFDKNADGTLLGEGIGMVVLKRLADAERDGDRIYAVIRGVGVASDGRGVAVMAPRVEGEELALRRAYEAAGVSPRSVGLIEAHGTATPVGDVAEVQALTRVFGPRDGEMPWCALGTVKSMISHTIPAAGIAGMIKTSLSLYHKVLPPTLNCEEPNPKLELEKTPFYISTETRPWIHGGPEPRRAGVNAFGFGGINSHAIVEEYVERRPADGPITAEREQGIESPAASLAHLPPWESEVFVFSGATVGELIGQAERFMHFVDALPPATGADAPSLKDLAFSVNCSTAPFDLARLSIVATSLADLREKLERAVKRLADPGCRQIKDRTGSYYFAEPLAREGKIAVLLPGEGAQYPNMLADLCLHFPEARAWFDQMDRVFYDHPRGYRLSDCVFPLPSFSEEERRLAETRLMQMDMAIEAVLTANRGMLAILERLNVHPDMYVGHSTGEYSALLAAGILDLSDERRLAEFSLALNRIYHQSAAGDGVPRAVLLAIGAERERVEAIAREAGGDIYLAMDNCLHQAVLVGDADAAERARQIVQREGLIYEQLLFDRAYHTPLFAPYAEQMWKVVEDVPIHPATVPAYSCTTAAPYSDDPAEIRQLVVDHWSSPVQFRRTVETLHAEGVRVFVEAGPRGNLTTFVEDILRGKSFCAVPANVQRRSGVTQINHLAAILTAQGVDLNLEYLYQRRQPRRIAWEDTGAPASARIGTRINLATGWPMLKLSTDVVARLQSGGTEANGHKPEAIPFRSPEPGGSQVDFPRESGAWSEVAVAQTDPAPNGREFLAPGAPVSSDTMAPAPAVSGPLDLYPEPVYSEPLEHTPLTVVPGTLLLDASAATMSAYLDTMDHFLAVAEEVTQTYLTGVESECIDDGNGQPAWLDGYGDTAMDMSEDVSLAPASSFPLLGTIVSWLPYEEVVARRTFNLNEDRYLCDHTFGRHISALDGELHGLAVMPLTMSLEILAEAAAFLIPDLRVIGLRSVRAHRWLAWDDQSQTLEVAAQRISPDGQQECVAVRLYTVDDAGNRSPSPVVEGTVVLANGFPPAPDGQLRGYPLAGASAGGGVRWRPDQYYTDVMFHGPSWQGVTSVDWTDEGGAAATLRVLPVTDFLGSTPEPAFVLDPVVLDAAGQVIGFWTAERLERGKIIFPFHLSALDMYSDARPVGETISCVASIDLVGEQQVRSDIDLIDAAGKLWMRLHGWEDKRFDLPSSFEPLVGNGSTRAISEPWPEPIADFPSGSPFQCRGMSSLLPSDRGLWKQVWSQRILSRDEREQFRRLRTPEHRQLEWLAGRTAAKEAVQHLLAEQFGLHLMPADIEISPDEQGRPLVGGAWLDMVDCIPAVTIAHSGGHAVALAALAPQGGSGDLKIGIDIETVRPRPADFTETAFIPYEMDLVREIPPDERDDWQLRLWCAKEAVAKALGFGLIDGPRSVFIVAADPGSGLVMARLNEHFAQMYPYLASHGLAVHTGRYGDRIVAATCCQLFEEGAVIDDQRRPTGAV